jgi:hypothetical protein
MEQLRSFSPEHLLEDAKRSGFFHCQKCGLVWFGSPDITTCPQGPHGAPVHVVLLCRHCDAAVPIESLAAHLSKETHALSN